MPEDTKDTAPAAPAAPATPAAPAAPAAPTAPAAAAAPAAADAGATKVPEKYDLKLSQDSPLDASIVERIGAISRAQGLSQDEAQAFLSGVEQEQSETVQRNKQQWYEQVQADKEVGGERFKESVQIASRLVRRFADPQMIQELNRTGLGNHPLLVRMLVRIGRTISEDTLVTGEHGAPQAPKSLAERLYPEHKQA